MLLTFPVLNLMYVSNLYLTVYCRVTTHLENLSQGILKWSGESPGK